MSVGTTTSAQGGRRYNEFRLLLLLELIHFPVKVIPKSFVTAFDTPCINIVAGCVASTAAPPLQHVHVNTISRSTLLLAASQVSVRIAPLQRLYLLFRAYGRRDGLTTLAGKQGEEPEHHQQRHCANYRYEQTRSIHFLHLPQRTMCSFTS